MRIIRLLTVDSTNLEARRRVDKGELSPLWIVSAEQTQGKGRLGRNWVSGVGNFYGTLIWPTRAVQSSLSQLSFVASLAVHATASNFAESNRISLKWPNDCLLDGAKFCGILSEVLNQGCVAIGIGINVAHVPQGLPYQAARLANSSVDAVFEKLQLNLSKYLIIWNDAAGFATIKALWADRCYHIGKSVRINADRGSFIGLAPDGAMLLRLADGKEKPVYAGDVQIEYE